MTDFSKEAVTKAVQLADAHHLLRHHALPALRNAARQVREASEQIGQLMEGARASVPARVAAIDALGKALTTLVTAAVLVEAQACRCGADERVRLDLPAPTDPTPEQIEADYIAARDAGDEKPRHLCVVTPLAPRRVLARGRYEGSKAFEEAFMRTIKPRDPDGAA